MPEIERDGEELPRLSPGVGCDSTAQGDNTIQYNTIFLYFSPAYMQCTCRVMTLNIFWSITSGKQWLYNNAQFCLFFTTVIRKIIYTIQ